MYKRERRSFIKHLDFTILDIICLVAAYILAYLIRIGFGDLTMLRGYIIMGGFMLGVDILLVFLTEPYKSILRRNKYQELKSSLFHSMFIFLGLVVYLFTIQRSEAYSRQILYFFWGFSFAFIFIARLLWKKVVRSRIVNDPNRNIMIVVTTFDQAEDCIEDLRHMEYTEFTIEGIVIIDRDCTGRQISGIPVVTNATGFYEYLKIHVVDEVFINGNTIESSEALADQLLEMGITVHYNLVHESRLMPNRVIEPFGNFVVMTTSMRIATPRELFVKRFFDILGGLVGLAICGVVFLLFAPRIKRQSPGPVIFSQTRVGKNGRKFKFYKFRSMYMDAEERKKELMDKNEMEGDIMFKMKDDPRIFPVGKTMRKYSLDELPQFWNVLIGDMSLVGTRPPTVDEYEKYEYWHKARLSGRPGITGMWQVSGRSNITDFEEIVALDTYYISHWNLWLDMKILAKTVQVVLKAKGAE